MRLERLPGGGGRGGGSGCGDGEQVRRYVSESYTTSNRVLILGSRH